MCGRFGLFHSWAEMHASYSMIGPALNLMPRYNIAPTQAVIAVIRAANGAGREATGFQWGLVPPWAKDPGIGAKMTNARSETVTEKPSFKNAFKRRRCLIPVSGFFEWTSTGTGPKQPVWIARPDGDLITFGGLWEVWHGPDGGELQTCTIVTTTANDTLKQYHHRMPVVLASEAFDVWLGDGPGEPGGSGPRSQPDDPRTRGDTGGASGRTSGQQCSQ